MVDRVGGDGELGAGREETVAERDAGAWGNEAGEAERGGRVDAEGFGDDFVEAFVGRGGRVLVLVVCVCEEEGWEGGKGKRRLEGTY